MSPQRFTYSLQPSIELHIDELLLQGLPLTGSQGRVVKAAVESELMRLISEQGLSGFTANAVRSFSASTIQITMDNRSENLGHKIAQAVYGGLTSNAHSHPTRFSNEALG